MLGDVGRRVREAGLVEEVLVHDGVVGSVTGEVQHVTHGLGLGDGGRGVARGHVKLRRLRAEARLGGHLELGTQGGNEEHLTVHRAPLQDVDVRRGSRTVHRVGVEYVHGLLREELQRVTATTKEDVFVRDEAEAVPEEDDVCDLLADERRGWLQGAVANRSGSEARRLEREGTVSVPHELVW